MREYKVEVLRVFLFGRHLEGVRVVDIKAVCTIGKPCGARSCYPDGNVVEVEVRHRKVPVPFVLSRSESESSLLGHDVDALLGTCHQLHRGDWSPGGKGLANDTLSRGENASRCGIVFTRPCQLERRLSAAGRHMPHPRVTRDVLYQCNTCLASLCCLGILVCYRYSIYLPLLIKIGQSLFNADTVIC